MKSVQTSGKSVEEALRLALIELDASREDIEFEVIEEGSKGFLGLIGGKDTVLKVTVKTKINEIAINFLDSMLREMGIEAKIDATLNDKTLNITVEGENMALLIGRRGQTLDAIQYLVSLVVNKSSEDYIRIILDTENYRQKRKETLEKLAKRLASKAKRLRKDIVLEPMNPYERRIIHSTLQGHPFVSTRSEGDEPYRKVIIFRKEKTQ